MDPPIRGFLLGHVGGGGPVNLAVRPVILRTSHPVRFFLCLLLIASSAALAQSTSWPSDAQKARAVETASRFVTLKDQAKYNEAYDMLSSSLRVMLSREAFEQLERSFVAKSGGDAIRLSKHQSVRGGSHSPRAGGWLIHDHQAGTQLRGCRSRGEAANRSAEAIVVTGPNPAFNRTRRHVDSLRESLWRRAGQLGRWVSGPDCGGAS